MANTHTVIAALKFQGGVVIAADSQLTEPLVQVRWPIEKVDQVEQQPLVIGFSDSLGMGQRARAALGDGSFRATTFQKRERVQSLLDAKLDAIHEQIKKVSKPPGTTWPEIGLTALAAFWADGQPEILDRDCNADSCFHECFHAIGSGGATAYAVYNTIGGKAHLPFVDEPKALMAMLRIIRTAIRVDMMGVSEPITAFIISGAKVRKLSEEEIGAHMQAVKAWEDGEQERFREMKL